MTNIKYAVTRIWITLQYVQYTPKTGAPRQRLPIIRVKWTLKNIATLTRLPITQDSHRNEVLIYMSLLFMLIYILHFIF